MTTAKEIHGIWDERLASGKASYERLCQKINRGHIFPSYLKVLALELTPEQADLIVDLGEGLTTEQLTKKWNIDENTLSERINELIAGKFIQRIPNGGYNIPQTPRFFPHQHSEVGDTLFTITYRDGSYPKVLVEGWEERLAKGSPPTHKVIPAYQALKASPNLKAEDILWYEDIEQIYQHSSKVTQGGWKPDGTMGSKKESGCGCRTVWDDACDTAGGCTWWAWKPGVWDTPETPPGAKPVSGIGMDRPAVTIEQAMKAVYQMEDRGQVKISPNTAQITGTCNCCPDCCVIIWPMQNYGDIYRMLAPSRFRAVIDEEKCTGCQTCVDRCHFDAIEMRKVPGSKKMKSFIISEHCMGCGLCIYKCPNKAMHLELVRPPEHIPTTKWGSPGANQEKQAQAARSEMKKSTP